MVLLTPDDKASPAGSSTEEKWRARQNVIMELGWFMARLGRERVLLLHQGSVEIPSDILGVIYSAVQRVHHRSRGDDPRTAESSRLTLLAITFSTNLWDVAEYR